MSILYKNNKDNESLSTLLAIRYLKSNIALNIGLENEADKAFKNAEKLRKENNIRKRIDSYYSITKYYHNKGKFEEVKRYALETIELAGDKKENKSTIYEANIMLVEAYIETGESFNKIGNVLKDIEENYNPKGMLLVDKYILYAKLYDTHGALDKSSEYLKKVYEILREEKDFRRKKQVLEDLIEISDNTNNKDDLLILYKEYVYQSEKYSDITIIYMSLRRVVKIK